MFRNFFKSSKKSQSEKKIDRTQLGSRCFKYKYYYQRSIYYYPLANVMSYENEDGQKCAIRWPHDGDDSIPKGCCELQVIVNKKEGISYTMLKSKKDTATLTQEYYPSDGQLMDMILEDCKAEVVDDANKSAQESYDDYCKWVVNINDSIVSRHLHDRLGENLKQKAIDAAKAQKMKDQEELANRM